MIGILLRLLKGGRTRAMDPLQVSMTGVRMGERFLQIGCHDRTLLAGLAAKVGLSGTAAVAAFDDEQAKRASAIGVKVGALIDIRDIDEGRTWPFEAAQFDMVVVDDSSDGFSDQDESVRATILRNALNTARPGGRIEVVTRGVSSVPRYDILSELTAAGFVPVRLLAEKNGFRFLEGLRPNS